MAVPRRRALALEASGAVVALLAGCSALAPIVDSDAPVRDEEGRIIEANEQTDAFALEVGDCLNDAVAAGAVTTVPTVPCAEPHDSEVYAAFTLGNSAYPGEDAVVGKAEALCLPAFENTVGARYVESPLDFAFYYPTEASWAAGDREVLCVIFDPDGPVTGSLRGGAG